MTDQKTILSWDAGIKNLAYCLLNKKDNKFNILSWGIINLMEDTQLCQCTIRGGKTCCKQASFCIKNKDETPYLSNSKQATFYSCKAHCDKFLPVLETFDKCTQKCCLCDKNAKMGISNTEYMWCEKHCDKNSQKFLKRIQKKKMNTASYKQNLQLLASKLFSILDKHKEFMTVDEVLIENQPTLKNPTMKTISSILYSYFVIRGINDKELTCSKIKEIKFISPSNKLKVNKPIMLKTLQDANKENKETYKLTKQLGIKYCVALINDSQKEILNKYKKKDDLCDAFLQGFQYLFNPVPNEYFEKLKTVDEIISTTKKSKISEKEDEIKSSNKNDNNEKIIKKISKNKTDLIEQNDE